MGKRKNLATFLNRFKTLGSPSELKDMYDGNMQGVSESYQLGTLKAKTLREALTHYKGVNRNVTPGGSSIVSRRMGPLRINGKDSESSEDDTDDSDENPCREIQKWSEPEPVTAVGVHKVMNRQLELLQMISGRLSTLERRINQKVDNSERCPQTSRHPGLLNAQQARMISATNIPRPLYGNNLPDSVVAHVIHKREKMIQTYNQMSTIGPQLQPLIKQFNSARDTLALVTTTEERSALEDERAECVMKIVKVTLIEIDRILSQTIKKPGKDGSGGKGLIFQTGGGLRKVFFGPLVVKSNSPCPEDTFLSREQTVIVDSVTLYPWTPYEPAGMPFLGSLETLAAIASSPGAVKDRMDEQAEKSTDIIKGEGLQRIKSNVIEIINSQITNAMGHIDEVVLPYFLQRLDLYTTGTVDEPNAGNLLLFVDVALIKTILDNPMWQPRYKRFPRLCPNRGKLNSSVLQVSINGTSKHALLIKACLHSYAHILTCIHPNSRNANVTDHANPIYKFIQDICEMDELLD
jgi:hypothetical protein